MLSLKKLRLTFSFFSKFRATTLTHLFAVDPKYQSRNAANNTKLIVISEKLDVNGFAYIYICTHTYKKIYIYMKAVERE